MSQWLKHNQLVANVTNSNYIIFSAKNTPLTNNALVQLDNVTLQNVKYTKFLGVYLDNQLLWHKHVEEIACKIYKKIPMLCKLRHVLPLKTMIILYHSLLHSHITYAVSVYGLTYRTTLVPLVTAQNTALRAILFMHRQESVKFAYKMLNIMPLHTCIRYYALLLLYRIIHNIISCPSIRITHRATTYSLRTTCSTTLAIPEIRTNYGLFSFSYMAPHLWNKLPHSLTSTPSFYMYKNQLKAQVFMLFDWRTDLSSCLYNQSFIFATAFSFVFTLWSFFLFIFFFHKLFYFIFYLPMTVLLFYDCKFFCAVIYLISL